jgi:prevent-host-death family protein
MAPTYSTYEAKARFSEVIRRVRAGQRVRITYRGEEIAEICPITGARATLEEAMAHLEDQGILGRGRSPAGTLRPVAKRRGALKRFLESRE